MLSIVKASGKSPETSIIKGKFTGHFLSKDYEIWWAHVPHRDWPASTLKSFAIQQLLQGGVNTERRQSFADLQKSYEIIAHIFSFNF